MSDTILGYFADGSPITQTPPGRITTRAFILCIHCRMPIKSSGGPAWGSVCVKCHDAEEKRDE